ncbi:MAG TPA: hypothetical protein VGY53_11480, partial [Isosphaeraceae bacterium]|nr:hypothetical protein [Isosphaeraceae bacterium]
IAHAIVNYLTFGSTSPVNVAHPAPAPVAQPSFVTVGLGQNHVQVILNAPVALQASPAVLPATTVLATIATPGASVQSPVSPATVETTTAAPINSAPGAPPPQLALTPRWEGGDSPLPTLDEPQVIAPLEWSDEVPAAPIAPEDAVPMPAQEPTTPVSPALLRALDSVEGLFNQAPTFAYDVSLASAAAPIAQPQTAAAAGVALLVWGWWEARSKKEEAENRRRRPFFQIF